MGNDYWPDIVLILDDVDRYSQTEDLLFRIMAPAWLSSLVVLEDDIQGILTT